MNEFKTCNICSGFDSNDLVQKLKELDNGAKIFIGCQSMCGIGTKRPFVIVNGIPVVADEVDELIGKIKEII